MSRSIEPTCTTARGAQRGRYANVTADGRVVGDNSLEDKADVVLSVPVENLLMLVLNKTHLPYAGLDRYGTSAPGGQQGWG